MHSNYNAYIYIYIYMHISIHTYIYTQNNYDTYIYIYIYIYMHTYTCILQTQLYNIIRNRPIIHYKRNPGLSQTRLVRCTMPPQLEINRKDKQQRRGQYTQRVETVSVQWKGARFIRLRCFGFLRGVTTCLCFLFISSSDCMLTCCLPSMIA